MAQLSIVRPTEFRLVAPTRVSLFLTRVAGNAVARRFTAQLPRMNLVTLDACLTEMHLLYQADPVAAVRSQGFIKVLHKYIADELRGRLHPAAIRQGVQVIEEAKLFGSHKPKDVDVAVIHPNNGPLMVVGVRSQMSSVGKNVLTYYQDIVGECISLQDRFPLATYGYAYLHPLAPPDGAVLDHRRFARMYEAISGRDGRNYREIQGVYDHFAYLVVDFAQSPPKLCDDVFEGQVDLDLSVTTFVDRMIETFQRRNIWLDIFE